MKSALRLACLGALSIVVWACCSCSSGSSGDSGPAPSVPSVSSSGSLGQIALTWSASTGTGLRGYNVYRSQDGSNFTQIASGITSTNFNDTIASPAGDGVFYFYRVTAVGYSESAPSNTVKNIHGTRVAATLASGLTTSTTGSPYILDGSVVSEGPVSVVTGTKLYLLDNGSLDILTGNGLIVSGLLQILASTSAPATLTSHAASGPLGPDQGFHMTFSGCVSYSSGDNGGTILQNARITNLSSWGAVGSRTIEITNCSPKFYNLYLSANNNTQAAQMYLWGNNGGMVMQHCDIRGFCVELWGDKRSLQFQMDHNTFATGDYNYTLSFVSGSAPPITAGQIQDNAFTVLHELNESSLFGGGTIPLGNNYWSTYPTAPTMRNQNSSDCLPDFTPMLSALPTGVGPTW